MSVIKNMTKKRWLVYGSVTLLVVISLTAVTTSVLLYGQYSHTKNPGQQQAQQLIARLQTVISLPSATPTVVTVSDKTKLANRALAARVKDQDMLLIYTQDKRIVIYRPSTQKVVDMLSFETPAQLPQNSDTSPTSIKP